MPERLSSTLSGTYIYFFLIFFFYFCFRLKHVISTAFQVIFWGGAESNFLALLQVKFYVLGVFSFSWVSSVSSHIEFVKHVLIGLAYCVCVCAINNIVCMCYTQAQEKMRTARHREWVPAVWQKFPKICAHLGVDDGDYFCPFFLSLHNVVTKVFILYSGVDCLQGFEYVLWHTLWRDKKTFVFTFFNFLFYIFQRKG